MIKVLMVGDYSYPIYASALCEAMLQMSEVQIDAFDTSLYLQSTSRAGDYIKRVENKLSFGPDIYKLNKELIGQCREEKYDLVFLYAVRTVTARAVLSIKENGTKIFTYCNDDPFSTFYPSYFWRNYRAVLLCSDINYVYRLKNISDVEKICGIKPQLLRSYYITANNYPCSVRERLNDVPEVIFLGHDEPDERKEYMLALAKAGVRVGLPRDLYQSSLGTRENIIYLEHERTLYNNYICSCKIPLVFLSKINHDTYTRRCFEIPAAGAFLLCPYTADLAALFEENKEIVFYYDKNDFVNKVIYYIAHDDERRHIAESGKLRLLQDGHAVSDRANQIMNDYKNLMLRQCLIE